MTKNNYFMVTALCRTNEPLLFCPWRKPRVLLKKKKKRSRKLLLNFRHKINTVVFRDVSSFQLKNRNEPEMLTTHNHPPIYYVSGLSTECVVIMSLLFINALYVLPNSVLIIGISVLPYQFIPLCLVSSVVVQ